LEVTGAISFPSLTKYDFHFTHFHETQLLNGMWRSYCTKLHPIKSRHVDSTCRISFKAQNITVAWLLWHWHMFKDFL